MKEDPKYYKYNNDDNSADLQSFIVNRLILLYNVHRNIFKRGQKMPKEVNPRIHVNERDYPITDHHCDDPEKAKKLAALGCDALITNKPDVVRRAIGLE